VVLLTLGVAQCAHLLPRSCTCFQPAVTRAKSSYVRAPKGSPFTITWKSSYVIAPQIPMFKIPGTSL
jgi:hypothetical protein